MNVVQVTLFEDITKKWYTYKVPEGIRIKKGYIVKVKNRDGREIPAVCVTDSEELSDNAVNMVMNGEKVVSSVIGMFSYMPFDLIAAISSKNETTL